MQASSKNLDSTPSDNASPAVRLVFRVSTPVADKRPVWIAGTFRKSATSMEVYPMIQVDKCNYEFGISLQDELPDTIEYRYLKGSWDDAETDRYGRTLPFRKIQKPAAPVIIQDTVPRWLKRGVAFEKEKLPVIEIISESFEIPQLIRTRRIAVLLPYDYYKSEKRYPVLYLQDGQNLFDEFAPFGTWGLDKRLAAMAENQMHQVIIVAIDHAQQQRIKEFTPTYKTKIGIGEGKKYARFIADTLKPYVDEHYRTLKDRSHTGIGGSSMGGLISLYTGLLYPEVFSKLMIFSPSLWVAPNLLKKVQLFHDSFPAKVYFYAGGSEGPDLLNRAKQFTNTLSELKEQGWPLSLRTSINPEGEHKEVFWGLEFPDALHWLFFEAPQSDNT